MEAPKSITSPYKADLLKLEPPVFLSRRFDDAMTTITDENHNFMGSANSEVGLIQEELMIRTTKIVKDGVDGVTMTRQRASSVSTVNTQSTPKKKTSLKDVRD